MLTSLILDVFLTITEHMNGKIFLTLVIFAYFRWIYASAATVLVFCFVLFCFLDYCSDLLEGFLVYRANIIIFLLSTVAIFCTDYPRHMFISIPCPKIYDAPLSKYQSPKPSLGILKGDFFFLVFFSCLTDPSIHHIYSRSPPQPHK